MQREIEAACQRAKAAARALATASTATKNRALAAIAAELRAREAEILAANARDLDAARANGLTAAMIDRLRLDPARLEGIAAAAEQIVGLPDPVGAEIDRFEGVQALQIRKVRVPLGVIAIIYESRPNVTVDAAVLALKSGNAVVLRGGSEAVHSNEALAAAIRAGLEAAGLPASAVEFLPFTDRAAVGILCAQAGAIDLLIPRGGQGLIRAVTEHARVPVLKHLDGVCHVFVADDADLELAEEIIVDAKVRRPSACNALETLLVDQAIAAEFLPRIAARLIEEGVILRGCTRTCRIIGGESCEHASEDDWRAEYLDLILAIRVVDGVDEAIDHIESFGSRHSDAIVTRNTELAERFLNAVDSAAVYWNASTRFTDGGCFGFGAEMGISTDKVHARGPVGLVELTSSQYRIYGQGQVRG